jgi:signal transduction histidine kinase
MKRRRKKEEERIRREREAALLREAKLKAVTIEQEKEIEKQKIRNRIAQDLHDEIGSNLSSISLMSDLIQKTEKADPDSIFKINRIHKVAKDSSQAMRDIVWITNPNSDNLKDLITKMNEVANDMLSGFNYKSDFPKETIEIHLSPETKRNVFLIFKEAVNNIVKHSEANNVFIRLIISDKNLLLAIKDDGIGFNLASGFIGNGLKNMQNRAKEINGILKLNSNSSKGTTLSLTVNITQVRD